MNRDMPDMSLNIPLLRNLSLGLLLTPVLQFLMIPSIIQVLYQPQLIFIPRRKVCESILQCRVCICPCFFMGARRYTNYRRTAFSELFFPLYLFNTAHASMGSKYRVKLDNESRSNLDRLMARFVCLVRGTKKRRCLQ